jgi:hypothetical protein
LNSAVAGPEANPDRHTECNSPERAAVASTWVETLLRSVNWTGAGNRLVRDASMRRPM